MTPFQKIRDIIESMDMFRIERMRFAAIVVGVFVFGIALRSAMFSSGVQKNVLAAAQPALVADSVFQGSGDALGTTTQEYIVPKDNMPFFDDDIASHTAPAVGQNTVPQEQKEVSVPTEGATSTDASLVLLADAYMVGSATTPMTEVYGKNIHERRAPASLTKLMTAVVLMENMPNDETVMITEHAVQTEGVAGRLHAGEQFRASDLLRTMLIVSSNDAAVAFADHFDEKGIDFIALMNAKAKELGMNDTHFANPSGLDDSEHYSSAFDLALLASYSLRYEAVWKILFEKTDTVYSINEKKAHVLISNNLIVQEQIRGVRGSKTGYTLNASGCMIVAMDTGEVIVVLGSQDRAKDIKQLISALRNK